jgi:hypothetical protein
VAGPGNISYRPVRAIGLLLAFQVLCLAGLGAHEFLQVAWRQIDWLRAVPEAASRQVIEAVALVLFVPPAVMTLMSALSFLLLRRKGWLLAAISQGLSLGICLWLYSQIQPWYVYPIMAYCILMILYLNSQDVRVVFHAHWRVPTQGKAGGSA